MSVTNKLRSVVCVGQRAHLDAALCNSQNKKRRKSVKPFDEMHGRNPELVVLIDYLLDKCGLKNATLGTLREYAENISLGAHQLADHFGDSTTLHSLANLSGDVLDDIEFGI